MELLYKYQNGNITISLYDDGTKVTEWDDNESPQPEFPTSFDLKLTDSCDLNCLYCHEKSSTKGVHGDIYKMLEIVKSLPAGTEIAIGGGNPLSHPELEFFLKKCKEFGLICNLTVNFNHVKKFEYNLFYFLTTKLIYGLGISIDEKSDLNILDNMFLDLSNIVYHIIAGVHNIFILEKIKASSIQKVLVLGYKEVGRGINYYDEKVELCKKEWYNNIHKYIGKIHLSFDNLAIKQLNIRRFFSNESWKQFYCGDDGAFTFYIDLPNQQFAKSSTSSERFPLTDSISEMFKVIHDKSS